MVHTILKCIKEKKIRRIILMMYFLYLNNYLNINKF